MVVSKKNKAALKILIFCLVVSLWTLTRKNCVSDPYCDPDPLFGGCPDSCETTWPGWGAIAGRTVGFYFLIAMGGMLGKDIFERN